MSTSGKDITDCMIAAIRDPKNTDDLASVKVLFDLGTTESVETAAICWVDENGIQPMAIIVTPEMFEKIKPKNAHI